MPTKIKVDVYKFEELSEKAKKKVLDRERKYTLEDSDDWWVECVYENYKETLEKLGYSNVKFNYSGFWSQGDGASFSAFVNIPSWIKSNQETDKTMERFKELYEHFQTDTGDEDTITIVNGRMNTVHSGTMKIGDDSNLIITLSGYDVYGDRIITRDEEIETEEIRLGVILDNLVTEVLQQAKSYGSQLYRELEVEFEGMMSDAYITENLNNSDDSWFLQNGDDAYSLMPSE